MTHRADTTPGDQAAASRTCIYRATVALAAYGRECSGGLTPPTHHAVVQRELATCLIGDLLLALTGQGADPDDIISAAYKHFENAQVRLMTEFRGSHSADDEELGIVDSHTGNAAMRLMSLILEAQQSGQLEGVEILPLALLRDREAMVLMTVQVDSGVVVCSKPLSLMDFTPQPDSGGQAAASSIALRLSVLAEDLRSRVAALGVTNLSTELAKLRELLGSLMAAV